MKKLFTFLLVVLLPFLVAAQEVCNNGIDDDGDGFIDLNDPDCSCSQVPVTSVIPNPSFEQYTRCPENWADLYCSDCLQYGGSTDYINTCGFTLPLNGTELIPFPDGDGIIGLIIANRYKESIGSCLTGVLQAGKSYQLTLNIASVELRGVFCDESEIEYGPLYITLYGNSECGRFNTNEYESPTAIDNTWMVLGTAYYDPVTQWGELTISFTPDVDIKSIVLGAPENLPGEYPDWDELSEKCQPYFLFDNLLLNESAIFGAAITASGNYCSGDMMLTANPAISLSPAAIFQWYKNGIAIIGATGQTYPLTDPLNENGVYKVKITDGSNCFISTSFTVSDRMPGPEVTTVAPTCRTNGSIIVTTVADSYSFDNGATWSSDPQKTDLPPGIYHLKIKYNSGCTSGAMPVILSEPVYGPAPDFVVDDATCGATGKITVNSPALEYSFDNGATWGTSAVLENIPSGRYKVKIKDLTGCVSYAAEVFVDQDYLQDPLFDIEHPTCHNDGKIMVSTVADAYSFDGGTIWQQLGSLENLEAGEYKLIIKIGECVSRTIAITLDRFNPSYPGYTITSPGCSGNGSITITSPGVEFSFDNGSTWQSTGSKANLPAGNYMLSTKDANGCLSLPVSVTLHATPWSLYPAFTKEDPSCEAGSITITTAAEEYSFDNGATWQRSASKTGLLAGNYGLAVKNAQGCISFTKYMDLITVPGTLNDPRYTVNDADCATGRGSITITTAAMEYSFDNGVTWVSTSDSGPLQAGSYRIKIKSTMGCESAAVLVTIRQAAVIPPPVVQPLSLCQGSIATPLTAAGTNLLWYTVQTGGAGNAAAPVPDTSVATTTTYYVSQTVNGCESVRVALVVTIQAAPAAPVAAATVTYCQGDNYLPLVAAGSNLLWYATATGGTASPAAPVPDRIGTNTWYVSQTVNGCESTRVAVSAIIKPLPAAPATTSLLTYLQYSQAVSLMATGTSLSWYDENYDELPAAPTPPTTAIGVQLYYVSQTVNGCEGPLAEIRVNVVSAEVVITFPPFFTPNGDNFNETWNVQPLRGQRVNTFVFDRYGKLLAQFFSPGAGWDGTYNGKLMPATDYWFLSRYTDEGIEKEYRSHFSLLR